MTTEAEAQVEQEQSASAMLAGFDSVRNPGQERSEDDGKQEARIQESDSQDEQQASDDEQEVEEARFAGMTESEIRALLDRTSRLGAIEEQLSKAHGKIGELNRTVQQLATNQTRPAPTASARTDYGDDAEDGDFSEIEEMFPEFSPAVERKARKIAQEVLQQHQQQNTGQPVDPTVISQTVALAVMDATRPKWRETVSSDDFQKWIESQPEDFRETYQSTWDTSVFSQVIDQFEAARKAQSERTTKSKTRLEAALTPDSRSSRVSHAATEMDAMQAGFDSVRNPRFYSTRH